MIRSRSPGSLKSGWEALQRGDYAEARKLLEAARRQAEEASLGPQYQAESLGYLAILFYQVGSSTSVPSGGSSLSAVDQVLADLARLLTDTRNAFQSKLSSVSAMWQRADTLAPQRFDALLSMGAGSRSKGASNDT